jgi:serine/threonine-protein kinase
VTETVSSDELRLREALAGRYSIERLLGRGGMGVVYLARDIALDRPVALKVLRWTLATATTRERFLREARTAASLHHPNIVPIHSVEEVDEWTVIAMGFVDGGSLADRLQSTNLIAAREAARLLAEVAHALAHAHKRGVVHRDVKPENILIDRESGRAMLADFGIAHAKDASALTDSEQLLGTPLYMSPEQASGEPVDGRTDLYALGVVGYRCLTGRYPFSGETPRELLAQHLTRTPRSIREVTPGTPRPLARAIDRCLRKLPADRFETAEMLASELECSIAPRRELPAVLANWVGRRGEVTLLGATFVPTLAVGTFFFLDFLLNPIFAWEGSVRAFDDEAGMLVAMLATLLTYGLRRLQLVRAVRRAGYETPAMREALVARAAGDGATGRLPMPEIAPRLFAGGFLVWLIVTVARSGWDFSDLAAVLYTVFTLSCAAGLVLGTLYRVITRQPSLALALRRRFWGGPMAPLALRLVGAGIRNRHTAEFGNQQTAVALGSAALVLYGGLPRGLRHRLSAVPGVLAGLEAAAARQRVRIEALDQLETAAPRLPADAQLEGLRAGAEAEVQAVRAAAVTKLHRIITAMELLRLDLLRLHARGGDVTAITANIEAALEISDRVDQEEAAQTEIASFLASPTPA